MKVLVICTTYPRFNGDNSAIFLKSLYDSMSAYEKGVELLIIASDDDNYYRKDEEDPSISNYIKVFRFRYFFKRLQRLTYGDAIMSNINRNKWLIFLIPFFFCGMLIKTFKLVIKHKPNIIHSHWAIPCGIVGVIIKRFFGTPLIVTTHGGDFYSFNNGIGRNVLRNIYRVADCINPVSKPLGDEISSLLPDDKLGNVWVQSMGVDPDVFRYCEDAREILEIDHNLTLLLFVGRLSEVKGVDVLLEALNGLDRQEPWECWIVGDGNLRDKIKLDISKKGLNGKVRLLGVKANSELKYYYSASNLVLIPSKPSVGGQEGLPVTLMEALLCNCNIVASNMGGMMSFSESKQITLFEPGNSTDLIEKIKDKWNIQKVKQSGEGQLFTIDRVSKRYLEKYSRIVFKNT